MDKDRLMNLPKKGCMTAADIHVFHTSLCVCLAPTPLGEGSLAKRAAIETLVYEGIHRLASGMPVVRCSLTADNHLRVQFITETSSDGIRTTPDCLTPWLPQGVIITLFSLERVVFSIDALHNESFLFVEIDAYLDSTESLATLKNQLSALEQQIGLTLLLPTTCQQMLTTSGLTSHSSSSTFQQELLHWLARHPPQNPTDACGELQRFLLTTDAEFKRIRTPSHLLKLVRSHIYLKQKKTSLASTNIPEKQLFFRLFPSELHFPFGTKDVLCLVICLRSLSHYERFDDRHILFAAQRCLPSLEAVPRSFYQFSYPETTTLCLYMEVEKKDGSPILFEEIKNLKRDLSSELIASVEQVMSRIDIPQNEEDLLRNLLLLSQQVKTVKDLPRVIVQFQGQTDTSLAFHVTIVRATKDDGDTIPHPQKLSTDILRCLLLRSSIVDRVRNRVVKQGLMFLVECSKERFLRRDRSVDFLKAREAVVHCIESAYGTVRDLNGGLIYLQHQLLASVRPLLTKEESKDISLIEDIFHSLSPTLMKEILGPEHIVTIFRQLLTLRSDLRQKVARPFVVEEYTKEIFIGFLCPETFVKETIFQAVPQFHLEENALAVCHLASDGHWFCFVICLSQNNDTRQQLVLWLQEKLNRKVGIQTSRSLRMCLPRPTHILDPRIGSDRTSGAIIKMLYEGLMRIDPCENPSLAAAEEVLISDDGKTYTFKLRQSFWSNGLPVTAYDFEYAWKKILDPGFQTYFDFLLYPILNARLVKAGRLTADNLGCRAASDRILIVELETPCPQFLELCSLWMFSPLCKDIDKTYPGWAYYGDKNYVCNGPFTLKQVSRTGAIQLQKNDRYWDKDRVFLEKIDVSIIEDPKKALQLFLQGELDWIGDPLSEVPIKEVKGKAHQIQSRSTSGVHCYLLNVHQPLFRSIKVRHAFSQALSRNALIQKYMYGDERPAQSILSSSLSLLGSEEALPFNLDNAQKLFAEGIAEEGLSRALLKPLKMMIYNQEPFKSIAQHVATTWEEAFGISITIELCSWNDFIDGFPSNSHDILGMVWYSWYRDPCYTLKILSNPRHHFNGSRWSNETMRELIDRGEAEQEIELRNRYFREAERLLVKEMPIVPVFECTSRYMQSADLNNIYVSHLGNVEFTWSTFKKHISPTLPEKEVTASSDEVKLYLQSEPFSLDPRIGGERKSQLIIRELFEGLTRIGKNGSVELALAQSLSVSDDGRVYTFHLHPSFWSNGKELTADDFVRAWKSLLDPSFPSKYAYGLFAIKNAKAASLKSCSPDKIGLRVLDTLTLEIELELPVPYFLELLSNPLFSPLPKESVDGFLTWSKSCYPHYVSNGPFILKEHVRRSHILLERNPWYWNPEKACSKQISFAIIDDPKTAYNRFQANELDWYGDPCGTISALHVDALERQGLLVKKQSGAIFWLNCRTDIPHLSSPKIRKAIASAIDRRKICDTLLHSGEVPAYSLLPQPMSLLEKPPFEENAESARHLFAEGLIDLGYSQESYPPIVITHWSDSTTKAIVHMIQEQLQHVLGIRVELAILDLNDYLKKLGTKEYQLQSAVWFPWYGDPMYNLQYVKYKDSCLNDTGWERAEYIKLLNDADTAQSASLRTSYLQRAEVFVMNELPLIPIFYQSNTYAMASDLSGEALSSTGTLEIKWLHSKKSLTDR